MTTLGGLLAAVALGALVLGLRPPSEVGRRLQLIAPARSEHRLPWRHVREIDLRHAGLSLDPDRFLALRVAAALAAAVVAGLVSLAVGLGPVPIVVASYGGAVAPSLLVETRARARRRDAERAAAALVERLEALVAAGRPSETALALLMRRPTGSPVLDATLRGASEAHLLGAPLFRTLAARSREEGIPTCTALAEDLERARGLGAASLSVIRDRRRAIRATQRTRSLEASSQVEGKLMLILVLCYLPALVALVIVPLFVGLLEGLFA